MALDRQQLQEAARLLAEARRRPALLDGLPDAVRPRNLTDAYAIQDQLWHMLGERAGGWFVGCSNPRVQQRLGLDGPYGCRTLASTIMPSGSRLPVPSPLQPVVEVEFAFTLGADLPSRNRPYARDEVVEALATVHPCIEVVIAHFHNWQDVDIASIVADNGTDGAVIHGEGREDLDLNDMARLQVELWLDGAPAARGSGEQVMGDPVNALVWLANHAAQRGDGLKTGQLCNTGTCTPMTAVQVPSHCEARFQELGQVVVELIRCESGTSDQKDGH